MSSRAKQTIGVILFSLGLLLGAALAAVATWGDLEASLFDPASGAEAALRSLACPVIITRGETGAISASFANTGTQPVNRAIRVHVSQRHVTLMREESIHVPIAAGAAERVSWPVGADDAAYGFLILARVSTLRQSPLLSETGSCGILVFDLPLVRGMFVTIAWVALSLAGMLGGGWLALAAAGPQFGRSRNLAGVLLALGGVVTANLILSLLGFWVAGVVLLALLLLMLVALVAQALLAN